MRIVVQRVRRASVFVDGRVVGAIDNGFCVLIGVETGDTGKDAEYIAGKIASLRVFEDEAGKMNRSIGESGGSVLLVSQFTLLGDVRKGNRPSFIDAAPPKEADELYLRVAELVRGQGIDVQTGVFRADMLVSIENDGPVTILLDSRRLF